MTVKNALKILDGYYEQKKNLKDGIKDPAQSWNIERDLMTQVAEMIADSIDTDLIVLNAIKKQIQPKCKHPKKSQDIDPDGNRYCIAILIFNFLEINRQ